MDFIKLFIEEHWEDFKKMLKDSCIPENEIERYADQLINQLLASSAGSVSCEAHRPDTCEWSKEDEDNDSYYETECGNAFICMNGDYQHNHFTHCPFCGGQIKDKVIEGDSVR